MPGQRRCGNTMINAWFLCLPLPLALTRTALEQSGARGGSNSAPFFGTCALPLLERRGARTCRGLGVMHGPSKGGLAQWAVAKTHTVTDTEVGWWLARHRLVSPAQSLARQTLSTAMEGSAPLLSLYQRSFPGAAGERDARVRVSPSFSGNGSPRGAATAERQRCPKGASLLPVRPSNHPTLRAPIRTSPPGWNYASFLGRIQGGLRPSNGVYP